MTELSHIDEGGKLRMVDVSTKVVQTRRAVAAGRITVGKRVIGLIRENKIKKGDVLTVARIAGIQAGKRASELIPLCHPLQIEWIDVTTELTETEVVVAAESLITGKTGVEMESLTAVSIALLTIYDMCKAVKRDMIIHGIHLVSKEKEDVPEV